MIIAIMIGVSLRHNYVIHSSELIHAFCRYLTGFAVYGQRAHVLKTCALCVKLIMLIMRLECIRLLVKCEKKKKRYLTLSRHIRCGDSTLSKPTTCELNL